MLTIKEFEILINNPESSTLDFKTKAYDFTEDRNLIKTSKFVKDVLSFCNTIRKETSYIIFGIQEENGRNLLTGINETIDDAILQDKVKDKVFPRPKFNFYTINYDDKIFGVLEFPVTKYSTPICPTVKIKGLEMGRIYFRRGTTNSEAIGIEIITINNWLQSLPELNDGNSLQEQINSLIKRLTIGDERLSTILADILLIARRHDWNELIRFCSFEIKGIEKSHPNSKDEFQYRVQTIKVSMDNVQINPHSYMANESSMKSIMENSENFYDLRMMFPHPINEIESYLERFNEKAICMTIKMNSKLLFHDQAGSEYNVIGYVYKDNYLNLYRNIKQKAIDKLMKV